MQSKHKNKHRPLANTFYALNHMIHFALSRIIKNFDFKLYTTHYIKIIKKKSYETKEILSENYALFIYISNICNVSTYI